MLVKTCVVTLLNKLIGATLHCEGDTHLVFDALVNSLVQDLIEEFKGHEYTQNATRNDAAFLKKDSNNEYRTTTKSNMPIRPIRI